MRNYLEKYDNYAKSADLKDAINSAFISLMNGYNHLFACTEFGRILVDVVYTRNDTPHNRVFVYDKETAPVNEFTSENFQEGFEYYIQIKVHYTVRGHLTRFKSMIYTLVMYGMIWCMYNYICDKVCSKTKNAHIDNEFSKRFRIFGPAICYDYNESFGHIGCISMLKSDIIKDLVNSSINPIDAMIKGRTSQLEECVDEIIYSRSVQYTAIRARLIKTHMFDTFTENEINTFYRTIIMLCAATVVLPHESYLESLFNKDSFKEYNNRLYSTSTNFIINWIAGALDDVIKKEQEQKKNKK